MGKRHCGTLHDSKHEGNEDVIFVPELEDAPDHRNRIWTRREEKILEKYYLKKSAIDIATYLNRSLSAVQNKARMLFLSNKKTR